MEAKKKSGSVGFSIFANYIDGYVKIEHCSCKRVKANGSDEKALESIAHRLHHLL
jgi:hypothetical protein